MQTSYNQPTVSHWCQYCLPQFLEDDSPYFVDDEECSVEVREGDADHRRFSAHMEVIVPVVDGEGGGEEGQDDQTLHHVDVVLLVGLDDAEHSEAQHDQHGVDKLAKHSTTEHSKSSHE